MREQGYPPGPPRSLLRLVLYGPGRDPLGFFGGLARQHGDIAHVFMAGEHVVLLNHPQYVKDVLVTDQRKFVKGRGLERAKRVLGQGLLTSEGATHLRQRRLMQPAFHKDRIASYAGVMVDHATRAQQRWTSGAPLDLSAEMMRLTLGIVGETLLGSDVDAEAATVGRALSDVVASFWLALLPFFDVIERLPLPVFRRGREARAELDRVIYRLIAERRANPGDRGDLLSMLLSAQDEENGGQGMTDQQVRDEAMTIFLAGHETTANALAWTWHLIGQSREVEASLHEELDRVLGGRVPAIDDLPELRYTEQIVTESMRLYPPAWLIGRRATEPYEVGGYLLPARTLVVMSPYVLHRDQRFFTEPDRFLPERWTAAFKAALPPFAYFPFGGGARRCIGESFAWMELVLVVATLAQRWRFEPVPGHQVVPQPLVTLRMKHGLRMTPRARSSD
ncbi:MAG: cytochrome P450 [Acidobacteriaceae bacterium]|nr:cytochrome P450 [Acidobacteriaceae bacterium]